MPSPIFERFVYNIINMAASPARQLMKTVMVRELVADKCSVAVAIEAFGNFAVIAIRYGHCTTDLKPFLI